MGVRPDIGVMKVAGVAPAAGAGEENEERAGCRLVNFGDHHL